MNDEFKPIKSSNLEAACHNGTTNEMTVQFKNGTQYRYFDISATLWKEFADCFSGENGKSAGKFFNANIKDKFSFEKIEE